MNRKFKLSDYNDSKFNPLRTLLTFINDCANTHIFRDVCKYESLGKSDGNDIMNNATLNKRAKLWDSLMSDDTKSFGNTKLSQRFKSATIRLDYQNVVLDFERWGMADRDYHPFYGRFGVAPYSVTYRMSQPMNIDERNNDCVCQMMPVTLDVVRVTDLWTAGYKEEARLLILHQLIESQFIIIYAARSVYQDTRRYGQTFVSTNEYINKPVKIYIPMFYRDKELADGITGIMVHKDYCVLRTVHNDILIVGYELVDYEELRFLDLMYRRNKTIVDDQMFDAMAMSLKMENSSFEKLDAIKSLQKVRTADKVYKMLAKTEFGLTASLKYDGCAVRLYFEDRVLIKAVTKGKQVDVTGLIRNVFSNQELAESIKNAIATTDIGKDRHVTITGELIADSVPRSLVSGYLNLKDADSTRANLVSKTLSFIAYDFRITPTCPDYETVQRGWLSSDHYKDMASVKYNYGLDVVELMLAYTPHQVDMAINGVGDMVDIDVPNTFYTDGLVFRINANSDFLSQGETAHHPKGAMAYKYEDDWRTTTVVSIEQRKGKNNVVKMIATFEPMQFDDKTVTKAVWQPVISYDDDAVRFDKLAEVGSKIDVCLRGKVIPVFRPSILDVQL